MKPNIPGDSADAQLEFLTFTLGGETYAVDILKVREVRALENLRRLHDVPAFVKGVLDLRGRIVPVIDLRIRFALPEAAYTATTVIIVISLANGGLMGMVVDTVADVLALQRSAIRQAPNLGSRISTDYLQGLAEGEPGMVMLIEVEGLLEGDEFELLANIDEVI